ncbi:S-adenosyl-L-methionine-dependent methyltransferase [Aureobasidium subglaciale]|nr:S-adenosyl-L-methionine-dependent methyltransferase [Aureobasidium subglaciale]
MADSAPTHSNQPQKRKFNEGKRHFKKNKKQKPTTVKEGSNEEVLIADVRALLEKHSISSKPADGQAEEQAPIAQLPEPFTEYDLTISDLSSTGDGLALIPGTSQVAVVPFTAPGDKVTVKIIKHLQDTNYTLTDFVKVLEPSTHRDDSLVKCGYFSKCSGCQFQFLPYQYQLDHKRSIVEKAYKNFCTLPAHMIPTVGDTIGSPLQYGYRTKLTPHFDGPPGGRRDRRQGVKAVFPEVPPIGFMLKGTRKTMDIEDCPIGTDAVRMGMKSERQRVNVELDKYQRGATLLLRESTKRIDKNHLPQDQRTDAGAAEEQPVDTQAAVPSPVKNYIDEDRGTHIHRKTCVTDQNAVSTEYVDDFRFDNPAGSFFQNNNSILPTFTQYIRDNILPKDLPADAPKITNLIDAYSGSGLFTVTLSPLFTNSIGIDVSSKSIEFASKNAKLNNIPPTSARFLAGDANNIFAEIKFPARETAVVIDPSRKGCDENFLGQLLKYGPERVCYVSCNVHTQARDVAVLVGGLPGVNEGKGLYEIESLRGFDFFPQTGHVEGVCFLRKKKDEAAVDAPTAVAPAAVAPTAE